VLLFPAAEVVGEVEHPHLLELGARVQGGALRDPGGRGDRVEDRATLYSSTEFKKIRLLYFTEDFKTWEREHAGV